MVGGVILFWMHAKVDGELHAAIVAPRREDYGGLGWDLPPVPPSLLYRYDEELVAALPCTACRAERELEQVEEEAHAMDTRLLTAATQHLARGGRQAHARSVSSGASAS